MPFRLYSLFNFGIISLAKRCPSISRITSPLSLLLIPPIGEITPEAILAKIGEADTVYVRVDVNKAYWVKGDEAGSVDLW